MRSGRKYALGFFIALFFAAVMALYGISNLSAAEYEEFGGASDRFCHKAERKPARIRPDVCESLFHRDILRLLLPFCSGRLRAASSLVFGNPARIFHKLSRIFDHLFAEVLKLPLLLLRKALGDQRAPLCEHLPYAGERVKKFLRGI